MAITPFYRERGNGYPGPEGEPVTGQNFFEDQLYSLKTRIEADPQYADFANKFGTQIGYRNLPIGDKVYIEMVINRVGEINPETNYQEIEKLTPPWLQDLVDKWIDIYPEYSVIITDQYPIKEIPSWWLAEIMPRLDITKLVQKTWFYEDDRSADDYDFFYENGSIYIKLVNEDDPDNIGPYSTTKDDLLKTGEKAVKRGEFSYGDRADFQTRYGKLHVELVYFLEKLYNKGVILLDSNSQMIKNWNLCERLDGINLYMPSWVDTRLTHYDGPTNLLKRQFENYKNQWDYQHVYYQVGTNRVLKHLVASYIYNTKKEIPIFYGSFLALKVSNYDEAVDIANVIDDIKDKTTGISVIPTVYRNDKSYNYSQHVVYIDMEIFKIINSVDMDVKLQITPSVIRREELDRFIKDAIENIPPVKSELTQINMKLTPSVPVY